MQLVSFVLRVADYLQHNQRREEHLALGWKLTEPYQAGPAIRRVHLSRVGAGVWGNREHLAARSTGCSTVCPGPWAHWVCLWELLTCISKT